MTTEESVTTETRADGLRRPGRPRRIDVERRVLDAAVELMTERGVNATTVNAVIKRSGVARATVYLRWPNREALITSAVRHALGRPVIEASGDVEQDLRRAADQARAAFTEASFRSVFPALVGEMLADPDIEAERLAYDRLVPGRLNVVREYRDLAEGQGLRGDIAPEVAADLVLGFQISHLLATRRPASEALTEQMVSVVIDGLRAPKERPAGDG